MPTFDYHANGRVFLQNGTIYYSPNSKRSVTIPPPTVHITSPFQHARLDVTMFKHPVWWTDVWGWLSFIPLSPSFLSAPFQPFCSMPLIQRVKFATVVANDKQLNQIFYKMSDDKIQQWKKYEHLIVQAAQLTRIRYKIPGNSPPKPSSFNYDSPFKSHGTAKRMINLSREWLVVWMGFISYIIAQTKSRHPNSAPDTSSPMPDWYNWLRNLHKYQEFWLDGFLYSTICSFDSSTPRAGLVYLWTKVDNTRPPINWFLDHGIPLWFIWTSREEQEIVHNSSLAYLRPPTDLVQDALALLFSVPSLPLAGLVMQKYFQLGDNPITNDTLDFLRVEHAPSFVFEFTAKLFIQQQTWIKQAEAVSSQELKLLKTSLQVDSQTKAIEAASFPFKGLLTISVEDKGNLYAHFDDYFAARDKRQAEMIKVESEVERGRRQSREKQPAIVRAKVFVWEKVESLGGEECYRRTRVPQAENGDTLARYQPCQRLYCAFSNEWDLCEDFRFGKYDDNYDGDDDIDIVDDDIVDDFNKSSAPILPIHQEAMDHENEGMSGGVHFSRDVLETMNLCYGYHSPLSKTPATPTSFNWESVLRFLGFVENLSELVVSECDQKAIMLFFEKIVNNSLEPELDELIGCHYLSLSNLFNFKIVYREAVDLFVFYSPQSDAVRWVLGIHSPAAVLYACRYILSNPHSHTNLTVAHRLLERGIPFRTLLPLECSSRHSSVSRPYSPTVYRFVNHKFTIADFDSAMLQCRSVLSLPQGRAALLRGGIIGRIAKEFLGADGVLNGPSREVTNLRVGYICPTGSGKISLCDDELTENERAIICGTYSLLTGMPFKTAFNHYV